MSLLRRFALSTGLLALLLLLLASGASARTFEKAMLGPESQNGVSPFPLYQDLGVKVIETQLSWPNVATSRPADPTNPTDPAYNWPASYDQEIADAQASGMQVLFYVIFTPSWANGGRDETWAPTDPQDYANFLIAASRRYPAVKRWMIWGEPCMAANFKPITYQKFRHPLTAQQKAQVQRYAILLDDSYAALKSVDPNNVVIGGNTWSVCDIRPLDWVRYMRLPSGRPPRLDLYGHNPIGLVNRQQAGLDPRLHVVEMYDLPRLQRYINRYLVPGNHHPIGLWLAEFFLPTKGNPKTNFVVSPSQEAPIIAKALRVARRTPTVTGFGYVYLYDTGPNGNAGLITAGGRKKAAYYAFKRG
jgi:hypothetical protein